ncbi:MAG: protein kinase [Phycisphaerae bacterium]|nr:protein kinase [Phycisphaerae bacterium]
MGTHPQPDSEPEGRLIEAARREVRGPGGPEPSEPAPGSDAQGAPPLPHAADSGAPAIDSIPGYSIIREIHRGGQGVVYEAVQKTTRRKVAIKVMREGPFASRQDKTRFEREVHVLAALKHPNIVAIHESGTAAGSFYFVMDYISGQPPDACMAAGRRGVRETLVLFQKICEAVNAAHLHGVIHRDLKPSNIRIDTDGEPQILDFGLAKVAAGEAAGESPMMTVTGQFVGSLPWASPEQAEGVPGKIDVRTDVYSLGVILYQMLTGRFPYDVVGNFREVLDRIITTPPVRPRLLCGDIDDEVETIVLKCLSKQRERRYQSAGELARDIGHYLAGDPIEAKRDSSWYVLRKNLRRYRAAVAVACGFVLVIALALIVSLFLLREVTVERGRAVQAKDDALQKLRDSYLAQTRAGRWSGRPGRRFDGLEALSRAAAIQPSPELRNEAIACMALADLRVAKEWDTGPERFYGLAFDGNLEHYAMSNARGDLSIRRVADNRELKSLPGPGYPAWIVRMSSGGRYVAAKYHPLGLHSPNAVWLWDLSRGEVLLRTAHGMSAGAVDFGADERRLAISPGREVIVYETATGTEVRRFQSEGVLGLLRFDWQGKQLAVSLTEDRVIVYDADDGRVVQRLAPGSRVGPIAWHPDGKVLAVACEDFRIHIYDLSSGQRRAVLEGHSSWPSDLAFSHKGKLLASVGGEDLTLRLWDPRDGQLLLTVHGVDTPASGTPWFGPGDDLLGPRITGSRLSLLEVAGPPECRKLFADGAADERLWHTEISPDGQLLAGACEDAVRLWDLERGDQVACLPGRSWHIARFTPDGTALIAGGGSGLWQWPLVSEPGAGTARPQIDPPEHIVLPDEGQVEACGLNQEGTALGVVASDSTALILDLKTRRETARFGGHEGLAGAILSPDGKWLACSTWHGSGIRVFDAQGGDKPVFSLPDARDSAADFSPDGRWLITRTGPEYRLWSVPGWQPGLRITRSGTYNLVGPAAFTRDGRVLAVVPSWRQVRLIDVATGRELATLEAPDVHEKINTLSFTPDGGCLVAGNIRRKLHVWDLRLIRQRLAAMGLDWDAPPLPLPAETGGQVRF